MKGVEAPLAPSPLSPPLSRRRRPGTRESWWMPAGMVHSGPVTFTIELEHEEDGRWIAEVSALPGVLCYGRDRDEALAAAQALALRVIRRTAREPRSACRVPQRHVRNGMTNCPGTRAQRFSI